MVHLESRVRDCVLACEKRNGEHVNELPKTERVKKLDCNVLYTRFQWLMNNLTHVFKYRLQRAALQSGAHCVLSEAMFWTWHRPPIQIYRKCNTTTMVTRHEVSSRSSHVANALLCNVRSQLLSKLFENRFRINFKTLLKLFQSCSKFVWNCHQTIKLCSFQVQFDNQMRL